MGAFAGLRDSPLSPPRVSAGDVLSAVLDGLRAHFRGRMPPAKEIAAVAGTSPRTVEGWIAGEATPQSPSLVRMMAIYPEVAERVNQLAGRKRDQFSAEELSVLRQALVIANGGKIVEGGNGS